MIGGLGICFWLAFRKGSEECISHAECSVQEKRWITEEIERYFSQAGKGFSNQEDQKNRDVVFYIFLKRNLLHRAALGWEHEAALYGKRKVFGMEPSGGM